MAFSGTSVLAIAAFIFAFFFYSSHSAEVIAVKVENKEVSFKPSLLLDIIPLTISPLRCSRVRPISASRFRITSYFSANRITLSAGADIEEVWYIFVCLHREPFLWFCNCREDNWKSLPKRKWTISTSPYADVYIDIMFIENLSGTMNIRIEEEFHKWRLLCLVIGTLILLLAPNLSQWGPFYYISSMALGICIVFAIVFLQAIFWTFKWLMRQSQQYATSCIFLLVFVFVLLIFGFKSALVYFGMNQETPFFTFVLVGVVIAIAGIGYFLVRKLVDRSISSAEFVKWALRIFAIIIIFQSTIDTPLATLAVLLFATLAGLVPLVYPGALKLLHEMHQQHQQ